MRGTQVPRVPEQPNEGVLDQVFGVGGTEQQGKPAQSRILILVQQAQRGAIVVVMVDVHEDCTLHTCPTTGEPTRLRIPHHGSTTSDARNCSDGIKVVTFDP